MSSVLGWLPAVASAVNNAKAPAPASPFPGYMTPEQQLALAQQQAHASIDPVLQALQAQRARQGMSQQAQQAAIGAVFDALTKGFGDVGPQLKSIFDTAQNNLQSFSAGSTSPDLGLMQQGLQGQSAAAQQGANAYPQIAGQQGVLQFLKAVQDANSQNQQSQDQIAQVAAGLPKEVQSALSQIEGSQAKLAGATKPVYKTVGGSLYSIDPVTGKSQLVVKAPAKPQKATFRTVGGSLYSVGADGTPKLLVQGQNPTKVSGGFIYEKLPGQGWVKVGGSGPVQKPVSYQHVTVGGHAYTFDPTNGSFHDPATGQVVEPKAARPKNGITPKLIAQARNVVFQSTTPRYYLSTDPTTPITSAQLLGIVNGYNKQAKAAGHTQINIAILKKANTKQLAALGIEKKTPLAQDVYLQLVRMGIPVRRAVQLMQSKYPGFGKGYVKSSPSGPAGKNAAYTNPNVEGALNLVKEYLGTPYSWGGGGASGPSYGIQQGANTKGFDCSGLLQFMWAKAGVNIPRVTYDQWKVGQQVAKKDLQPGDAVFFEPGSKGPEHVGIYIGGGKFIEAPHTGAVVRISSLAGRSDYVGARRYGGTTA